MATAQLIRRNLMKKLIILALILLGGTAVNAEKVYKWVDKDGQIHYSNQKPPGEDVETVKIKKAPKVVTKENTEDAEEAQADPETAEEPVDPKAEKEAKEQMAKADAINRKKQCDAARKNLNALNTSTRVATVDEATGARTLMTDEQRVKAFQQANKAIKDFCN